MAEVLTEASTDKRTGHFPDDVLFEIFLRLPVRSLLLFKSVSKQWLAVIQNPNFVKLHINRPIDKCVKDSILVVRRDRTKKVVLTLLSDDETVPYHDDVPLESAIRGKWLERGNLQLLGPCNGVFCITNSVDAVVFNPATKRYRTVYRSHCDPGEFDCVGFGYDPLTNNYKVVWFHQAECDANGDDDEEMYDVDNDDDDFDGCVHGRLYFRVEIYSLAANSWKEIGCHVRKMYSAHSYNLFFNGAFHWLHAYEILVFDLNKEAFKWLKLPDAIVDWLKLSRSHMEVKCMSLSVLNESLAMTVRKKIGPFVGFELWVMMEYGVCESWILLYKVSHDVGIRSIHRPLSFSEEGELLGETKTVKARNGQLMSYNFKSGAIKTFQVQGVLGSMHAFRYRESFVSLN